MCTDAVQLIHGTTHDVSTYDTPGTTRETDEVTRRSKGQVVLLRKGTEQSLEGVSDEGVA